MTLKQSLPYILAFAVILAAAYFVGVFTSRVDAAAPGGVPATQLVATTTTVGPQQKITVFSMNNTCAARIVRTQGVGIFLVFADPTNGDLASTTLNTTAGFFQSASTTVAYDAGLYGCGRMVGYAEASTTITVSETI